MPDWESSGEPALSIAAHQVKDCGAHLTRHQLNIACADWKINNQVDQSAPGD